MLKKVLVSSLSAVWATSLLIGGASATSSMPSIISPNYDSNVETLFEEAVPTLTKTTSTNIQFLSNDSFTIGESTDVPKVYDNFKKYGMVTSDVIKSKRSFQSVVLDLKNSKNPTDTLIVEARASKDGNTWTEWLEPSKNTNEVQFYDELNYVQYRITLLTNTPKQQPIIHGVSLKLRGITKDRAQMFANKKQNSVSGSNDLNKPMSVASLNNVTASATKFSVNCFATREGLVGYTTANGHKITATDKFVALPSRKSLNSNDTTSTYTVTVSANSKQFTVPVWDIGPFNERDDYWNTNYIYPYPNEPVSNRDTWGYEGYGDLPRGSAQTYRAFYNGFHNGWTSSHRISSMTAYVSNSNPGTQVHDSLSNPNYPSNTLRNNGAEIDLSDGLWDALGMTGNGFVNVTFNWVDQ